MITIAPELRELPHYQLADLLELQGDLKDLTERNAGKLRRSITKHGLFVPFFVWPAPDGNTYILDGHQRKRTLVKDGHGALPVPCVLVHADTLPEAKEKLLVISSQYGRITQEGFDEFTFDLPDVGELVHFDALSFEFGQDEDEEPEQGDAEPQIDRAAELQEKWQTERGQLWAIGEHRLLCGDSTVRADVERVMGGERAVLMVTDPPYGIDHDTTWREEAGISTAGPQSAKNIEWDGNADWRDAYELSGVDVAYVWHATTFSRVVADGLESVGLVVKQQIIWNKTVAAFGRSHYNYKHEPCWYAVRKNRTSLWIGPANEVTVWDVASPRHIMGGSDEEKQPHSTQKPLECMARPIRNHDAAIIYDPFAGSGTTLVACQNLNRRGRAIEISEKYTAVILQRMSDAFPGIHIELLESA